MTLRHKAPHLRCGCCDEPIEAGPARAHARYLEDELCHAECARAYEVDELPIRPYDQDEAA